MSEPTLFGAPTGGIVGTRQLIAVQTVDLGRLTHHPVPLVPSALVAVSGTGPDRDSNGSGKTTFLAAVSLLLGDPEWRVATSGGGDALGLLFDPDLSGDAAGLYDPARLGYVAGVFAQSTADGNYDELTVWVRISSDDSPRLAARWSPGVHLAADRDVATRIWNGLGRERQIGPTSMVEQLYGGTGRCLAYVTSRGTRDTDTSLMQLQARLSPARIGNELIILLGLEHLIDGERDLRAKLADAQQRLAARIDEHERRERDWEARLADIAGRDQARASLTEGRRLWRLRVARKLLDALAEERRLTEVVAELAEEITAAHSEADDLTARLAELPDLAALARLVDQAAVEVERANAAQHEHVAAVERLRLELRQLTERIGELTRASLAAPSGVEPDAAEAAVQQAQADHEAAIRRLGAAEGAVADARDLLDAVTEHGAADPRARKALDDAGVSGVPLLDGIELADGARDTWEPLLAPWGGALVVSPQGLDVAIEAAPPGTSLVVARHDGTTLPAGVVAAPSGSEAFLTALVGRADAPYTDAQAGVVVVGGFEHELCGRDAAIARARSDVERAEQILAGRTEEVAAARSTLDTATRTCLAVRAVGELAEARAAEGAANTRLAEASASLAQARDAHDQAHDALVAARVDHDTAAQRRERLDGDLATVHARVADLEAERSSVLATIERVDVPGWRTAWGDTDQSAVAALADDDRKEDTFRRRASDQLLHAFVSLGIDPNDGAGAPTPTIAGVVRARSSLDEEVSATYVVRRFDTVAAPVGEWLDDNAEEDAAFQDDVAAERQRWDEQIGAARDECDTQTQLLDRHRDMVEAQIETALGQVSERYGELDAAAGGYGARLDWRSIRPDRPSDLWTWEVRPEWRRGHGAKWLPYTRQANSAMQKQHRTHLVLAALLAARDPAGRVLIVDEAGNDFGREHLRQVLSAFADVARGHGVTVIAACQDKVLEEVAALGAARLLLWFERLSDASPLCRPTRAWGFDDNGARVELTRSAIEAGRLV